MCVVTHDRTCLKLNDLGPIKDDGKEFSFNPHIKFIKKDEEPIKIQNSAKYTA